MVTTPFSSHLDHLFLISIRMHERNTQFQDNMGHRAVNVTAFKSSSLIIGNSCVRFLPNLSYPISLFGNTEESLALIEFPTRLVMICLNLPGSPISVSGTLSEM